MGLLRIIFNWLMLRKLKNDPSFISAIDEADEAAEDLRSTIRRAEKNGVIVPDSLKKYSGMKNK